MYLNLCMYVYMLISIILICLYIVLNKYHKDHSIDRFISCGLKRKTDRILFGTVILICGLFSYKDLPSKPGILLLLSCLGVAVWDHSQTAHYFAAFGVAFVVSYLVVVMATDIIDILFILCSVLIVTVLVLAGLEKKFDSFISQCEHIAFGVAAIYFIRQYYKNKLYSRVASVNGGVTLPFTCF